MSKNKQLVTHNLVQALTTIGIVIIMKNTRYGLLDHTSMVKIVGPPLR
jgi:hypothetical protein